MAEVYDLVTAIKNRCEVVLLLLRLGEEEFIPTVVKDLAKDTEELVIKVSEAKEGK